MVCLLILSFLVVISYGLMISVKNFVKFIKVFYVFLIGKGLFKIVLFYVKINVFIKSMYLELEIGLLDMKVINLII